MQTQWRTGANGVVGLDYNVLYRRLDRMNLAPNEYDQMESDIHAMEIAALNQMQDNREQA